MNSTTVAWALTLFFGASLAFAGLRRLTEGESTLLVAGVQIGALVVIVAAVVVVVRWRERR